VAVLALVGWLLMKPTERTVPTETASTPTPTTKPAGPKPNTRPKNDPLMQKMLTATAMVLVEDPTNPGQSFIAAGSGVLVHRQRRLLLTSNRTTQANDRVAVAFPSRKVNDELHTDLRYYLENARNVTVPGKVVSRQLQADLALVELERLPAAADELKLASYPIVTGGELFSLGASDVTVGNGDGTLWQLSSGTVKRRFKDLTTFPDRQTLNAMVIESTKQLEGGDSGGPTVNAIGAIWTRGVPCGAVISTP